MDQKLYKLAKKIYNKVPAFREFLWNNFPDDLSNIYMTKDNYIKKYDFIKRTIDWKLSDAYFFYFSSWTSWNPTLWPELRWEQKTMKSFVKIMKDLFQLKQKRNLLIVWFSLGSWIGGEYVAWLGRNIALEDENLSVVTPWNDYDEIAYMVENLSSYYDQTIIAMAPSSVWRLLTFMQNKWMDIKKYNFKFICFGEGFSDSWRVYINEICGGWDERIVNIYGASDIWMLAIETKLTHKILQKMRQNPSLTKKYFWTDTIPTFGITKISENTIIEVENNELIISKYQAVPLFRYKIKDKWWIIPLKKFKEDFKIPYFDFLIKNYYILYVNGRVDDMIIFNSSNFYKDVLEKSLDFEPIKSITKQIKVDIIDNEQKFVLYFDKNFEWKIDENLVKEEFIQNLRTFHPEFKEDFNAIFSKMDDYRKIIAIKYADFSWKIKVNLIRK